MIQIDREFSGKDGLYKNTKISQKESLELTGFSFCI